MFHKVFYLNNIDNWISSVYSLFEFKKILLNTFNTLKSYKCFSHSFYCYLYNVKEFSDFRKNGCYCKSGYFVFTLPKFKDIIRSINKLSKIKGLSLKDIELNYDTAEFILKCKL